MVREKDATVFCGPTLTSCRYRLYPRKGSIIGSLVHCWKTIGLRYVWFLILSCYYNVIGLGVCSPNSNGEDCWIRNWVALQEAACLLERAENEQKEERAYGSRVHGRKEATLSSRLTVGSLPVLFSKPVVTLHRVQEVIVKESSGYSLQNTAYLGFKIKG